MLRLSLENQMRWSHGVHISWWQRVAPAEHQTQTPSRRAPALQSQLLNSPGLTHYIRRPGPHGRLILEFPGLIYQLATGLSLTSCVTLDKLLTFVCLYFLACKTVVQLRGALG